ncbi:hypothetical protein T439DRAFT_359074 [Meredithblackwellia eburnea MCA 4105]
MPQVSFKNCSFDVALQRFRLTAKTLEEVRNHSVGRDITFEHVQALVLKSVGMWRTWRYSGEKDLSLFREYLQRWMGEELTSAAILGKASCLSLSMFLEAFEEGDFQRTINPVPKDQLEAATMKFLTVIPGHELRSSFETILGPIDHLIPRVIRRVCLSASLPLVKLWSLTARIQEMLSASYDALVKVWESIEISATAIRRRGGLVINFLLKDGLLLDAYWA